MSFLATIVVVVSVISVLSSIVYSIWYSIVWYGVCVLCAVLSLETKESVRISVIR